MWERKGRNVCEQAVRLEQGVRGRGRQGGCEVWEALGRVSGREVERENGSRMERGRCSRRRGRRPQG